MFSRRPATALLVILTLLGSKPLVGAEHPANGTFFLRRLIVSSSAKNITALKVPEHATRLVLDNEPFLSTKAFADLMAPYFGQPITLPLLDRIANAVTYYVREHGQQLVHVSIPAQSVSNGDLRLLVIIGRYDLHRLILAPSAAQARSERIPVGAGAIVVSDLPALSVEPFAVAVAPSFGQPITDESVDTLVQEISAFLASRGQILADVALAPSHIAAGELRLAVMIGRYPLRHVVIAPTQAEADAIPVGPESGPITIQGLTILQSREFFRLLAPYLGQPISKPGMDQLRGRILEYIKAHDRIALGVPPPFIDLRSGTVRLSVTLEHYGQVQFLGNRWFSNELLTKELGFKPGQEVSPSQLEAAIDWVNENPFMHAQVLLNALHEQPGTADVDVAMQEVAPIRVSAAYDDTGNNLLGNNHYTGTLQFGNLWGLNHQLTYQYATSDVTHAFNSDTLVYRLPLPWRNYLTLSGSFTGYRTYFEDGFFHLKGLDVIADAKYVIPVLHDTWSLEYSLGFDFKRLDLLDDYILGPGFTFPALASSDDVAQATAGITYIEHSAGGTWAAVLNGNFSPGGLDSRDTSRVYQGSVALDPVTGQPIGGPEAQARYMYATGLVQRVTFLPDDLQLLTRAQGQLSSARLLSSERMSIGGAETIRGYDERIESGDNGWAVTQEVHSPAFNWHLPLLSKTAAPLATRLIGFWDYGRVYYKHVIPSDEPMGPLMSAGLGIRSNLASNVSVSADYGWQILEPPSYLAEPYHGRWHLQATLAY